MPYKDPIISKIKSRERSLKWKKLNPEKVKEIQKRYYEKHPEKVLENNKKGREWYVLNKEKSLKKTKEWRKNNVEKRRVYRRAYKKTRYYSDIQYKLAEVLRSRIRLALRNGQKTGSAIKDLGCTIEVLKIYLEKQFQPGMTWENWKIDGWHIDHDVPLDAFDLSDREQFLRAVHYTNLQPMWASINLKKSNKII